MSGLNKKNQAGFRVAHDFDDFMEDREVVLTLQDSYILGGQDINPEGDVLENIDMAENYKSQVNIDNRTAKKDDYLDNKYGFGEKKILPQYDEKSTEKEGIMLDSYGEFNLDRQRKIEAIKNKLAGPKKGGEISLETSKNVASEYLTSDEMKKFKKPVKKAVVHKNKQDILKFLEDSLEDEEGNLGTRDSKKARERADLDDVTTKKLKTENYEAALEKAREQTKQSAMVDEEYDEIQRAIENQRRAAQQKKNNVEDIVRTLIGNTKTANSIDTNEVVILDNKKKPADAEFIELDSIKASTDFLRGVATRDLMLEQKAKITEPVSLSLKDTRNGMASVVNVSLPSERLLARNKAQSGLESLKLLRKEAPTAGSNNTEKKDEAAEDIYTAEDLEQLAEERNFIAEDDFNEGGLAAALKAARERGYLMENEAEIRGRGKDKTYREELAKFDKPGKPSKNDGDERVRLEYRDKNGRLMTPKEAFRYQCRIFHGIDPSKTKQEKERKKWEASKKSLQIAPQESGSMKAFQILQKQNNQAHVVLDTKNLK